MKSNIHSTELQDDKVAAIGIGAMIVFIALILVAAVAAAVIIQTAEALQQNAQQTGDDTADNMAGKVMINSAYVDANGYKLFVRLAPGSDCEAGTVGTGASVQMYIHVGSGGTTCETLSVQDTATGSKVV